MGSRELTANELRVGNIVFDSLGNHFIVDGMQIMKIQEYSHSDGLTPIPISRETLEDIGFVKVFSFKWLRYKYCYPIYDKISVLFYKNEHLVMYGDERIDMNIAYIHQLQNVFYSLTRFDLPISLTKLTQ